VAGCADSEKILALPIIFAVRQILVVFNKAENSTAHKNMGVGAMIRFDLFQAFIGPIDAIPAINHNGSKYFNALEMGDLLRLRDERLVQSNELSKFLLRLQSRKICIVLGVDPAVFIQRHSFLEIFDRMNQISFHCL